MRIAATFDASRHGSYGAYSGTFTHVKEIRPSFTSSDYQQWLLEHRRDVLLARFRSVWFLSIVGWMGLFIFGVFKRSGR